MGFMSPDGCAWVALAKASDTHRGLDVGPTLRRIGPTLG